MAEKSGFFNSVNGDRKYDASRFAEYFASFIGNGVFPSPSTGLQVVTNSNMAVIIKPGKAWINGYYYSNDSDLVLNLEVAGGVLNRIDRIILQFNTTDRIITAKVKKGTLASSPVPQVLQRDADAYELGLADIYIGAGVTSISQANITDLRMNSSYCGVVSGTVDQIDASELFVQFEDGFNTFFNSIKNTLGTDPAGNLFNLINNHKADTIYQTAGGTATAITLTISETLENGLPITFIASANNSGAVTTINNKPLYKPNTTTSPTIKAGRAYTVWYDAAGDCFFIKASAEGNVTADKVLAGYTFSNEFDVELVGTLSFISITAGDQILLSILPTWGSPPLQTFGDSTFRKLLNGITMNVAGTFRVKATVNGAQYSGEHHKYQFYLNGSPIGSIFDFSTSGQGDTQIVISQDFTCSVGDVLTLYGAATNTGSGRGFYMKDFQVCAGAPTNITYATSL